MGSERIKVEQRVKDCGNGWCDRCDAGKGHTIKYTYNSIVDMSTITLDGTDVIIAPDLIVDLMADLIIKGNKGAVK